MSNPHAIGLVERELQHEEGCIQSGSVKYLERIRKHRANGSEAMSDYGKRLMSVLIEPLAQAITDFVQQSRKGAGRKFVAAKHLADIDPQVASFITARETINSVSKQKTFQRVAMRVGKRIEDELRFTHFEKAQPKLFKRVNINITENNPFHYSEEIRGRIMAHAGRKFKVGWQDWENTGWGLDDWTFLFCHCVLPCVIANPSRYSATIPYSGYAASLSSLNIPV